MCRLFSAEITTYPFQVEDADHCETDAAAYEHIEPLLSYLCTLLKKTRVRISNNIFYWCMEPGLWIYLIFYCSTHLCAILYIRLPLHELQRNLFMLLYDVILAMTAVCILSLVQIISAFIKCSGVISLT